MPLINGATIQGLVRDKRGAWIGGGYGGGKTSFAYRLAYEYLKMGYRLVTNNHSVWADDMEQVELLSDSGMQLKVVFILDEGGQYFKTSREWEEMAQYVRKMDVIFLVPSHSPPTAVAQEVCIEPVFSFRPCGIPLIAYRWLLRTKMHRDSGFFAWWMPNEIYGVYSTLDPGGDCEDIVDFVFDRTYEFKEFFDRGGRERKYQRKHFGSGLPSVAGKRGNYSADADILEAAAQFAQVANSLEAVSSRKRGRWRRFV